MQRRGYTCIVNYLDDFLIIAYSYQEARNAQLALIRLLRSLGFAISWAKLVSPTTRVEFLGIVLDSLLMEAQAPSDKLARLRCTIDDILLRRKASKRELQSLAGLMNFTAKVIRGARTFLRRILDVINGLRRPHFRVRLTHPMKQDLLWWRSFMHVFNGKVPLVSRHLRPTVHVFTDASFDGYGAYVNGCQWLAGAWRQSAANRVHASITNSTHWLGVPEDVPMSTLDNINCLELYAVLQSARLWAPHWINQRVLIHTDNTQVMYAINKGTCRNTASMTWLRELFWLSACYNFHLSCTHVKGQDNVASDCLSRLTGPAYLHLFLSNFCDGLWYY